MTRSHVGALLVASLLIAPGFAGAQATTSVLLPEQQAQHALNRLAFGPRPGDVARVRAMGVDMWVDQQLHPEKMDDRAMADLLKRYETLDASTADIAAAFRDAQRRQRERQREMADDSAKGSPRPAANLGPDPAAARELQNRAIGDLMSAKIARAAFSERQLYEVMVDFWENHFSVFVGKGQTRVYLVEYDRDVVRPRALGKFRDLLGAVAISPAMLFYLDNAQSRADSMHATLAQRSQQAFARNRRGVGVRPGFPGARAQQPARGLNENYARELMELHTLGVDGGYTQQDVIEVARALTGWTIDPQRGAFVFNPAWHDADQKVVLGNRLSPGRGMEDGEQVLDIVVRHPSTARHLTTKLTRRFISDDPPSAVVDRCAKVFTKTDGDIRETVGCILKSQEFWSPAAYRAKVKTPFEVLVSGMRATNAQLALRPGAPQAVAFLGQPLFGRQTPDGWPDVAREWMNAGAILNRINFGLALAGGRVPGVITGFVPELEATRSAPREQQVDAVVRVLFGGQVYP